MIGPALAARQLILALLLGCVAGIGYGILRPARPRWLADGIFGVLLGGLWVYLGFAVCDGDLRLLHTAVLFLGAIGFHFLFGRWLIPVYSAFWQGIFRGFAAIFRLFRKIFQKITNFLFPTVRKWSRIKEIIKRRR